MPPPREFALEVAAENLELAPGLEDHIAVGIGPGVSGLEPMVCGASVPVIERAGTVSTMLNHLSILRT